MKHTVALCVGVIALTVCALTPNVASANVVTLVCQPAADPAPPEWFGGSWLRPLMVRVDSDAKSIELLDQDNTTLTGTVRAGRLAGLAGYQMDITINENVINWGLLRMWGVSGYLDRKSGRIDALWAMPNGYSPNTLIRQFHGTCRQR